MTETPPTHRSAPAVDGRRHIGAGISFAPDVFAAIEEKRGYEARSSFVNRLLRRILQADPADDGA